MSTEAALHAFGRGPNPRRDAVAEAVRRRLFSRTEEAALLGSVQITTLVLDSMGSSGNLTGWAATVANKLPHGSHRSLAGEWHTVPDETLAPVLIEFFRH